MPRRTDIASILIIGAGPIVIGQACEFDYSGVQACKALRAQGYVTVAALSPADAPDGLRCTHILQNGAAVPLHKE